jgi:hypothetical protein
MSNRLSASVLASILAMTSVVPGASKQNLQFRHKKIVKRENLGKLVRMGRNRDARGFDPITNKWVKL